MNAQQPANQQAAKQQPANQQAAKQQLANQAATILEVLWEPDDTFATYEHWDDAAIRHLFEDQQLVHRFLARYSIPMLMDVYEGVPMKKLEFLRRLWLRFVDKDGSGDEPWRIWSVTNDGTGTEIPGVHRIELRPDIKAAAPPTPTPFSSTSESMSTARREKINYGRAMTMDACLTSVADVLKKERMPANAAAAADRNMAELLEKDAAAKRAEAAAKERALAKARARASEAAQADAARVEAAERAAEAEEEAAELAEYMATLPASKARALAGKAVARSAEDVRAKEGAQAAAASFAACACAAAAARHRVAPVTLAPVTLAPCPALVPRGPPPALVPRGPPLALVPLAPPGPAVAAEDAWAKADARPPAVLVVSTPLRASAVPWAFGLPPALLPRVPPEIAPEKVAPAAPATPRPPPPPPPPAPTTSAQPATSAQLATSAQPAAPPLCPANALKDPLFAARVAKALKKDQKDASALEALMTCPISHDLMRDPVVAADGHTYERRQIEAWIAKRQSGSVTSPMTAESLVSIVLFPNVALRNFIRQRMPSQNA